MSCFVCRRLPRCLSLLRTDRTPGSSQSSFPECMALYIVLQLTGIALSQCIMRKTGVRWEDVTVEDITVDDLDEESFKIFRREALRSGRMTQEDLDLSRYTDI